MRTDHLRLQERRAGATWRVAAILERIATNAPVAGTLDEIVRWVEEQMPGARASLLTLDADGKRLHAASVRSLPAAYNAAIDGLEVGPNEGSCGTAAFSRRAVFVNDIATDPLWEKYRALALPLGLRACWSTPVLSRRRADREVVLGTFAVYFDSIKEPDGEHREILEQAEYLVCIAIEAAVSLSELREGEARFRTFVDHATDAFFLHAIDGTIVDVNRNACLSLGYTRDELIGALPSLFDAAATAEAIQEVMTLVATGETASCETNYRRKDGTLFPVEVRVRAFDDGGERQVLSFARDISERRRAERALLDSAEALRRAQQIARLGNWVFDLPTASFSGSPEASRILGWRPGEGSMNELARAVHPDDLERATRGWTAMLRGKRYDIEHRIVVHGEVRWIHVWAEPSRTNLEGVVSELSGVMQDVTERRELEEQLRQSQKMEAVGLLAGGAAHDFNNLLTIINGYADILLATLPPSDREREDVEAIRDAGQRAAALTGQLLAFSRRSAVSPVSLNLNELTNRLVRMFERLIGDNIVLETTLDPDLYRAYADESHLEQVLMNLVVNARDALPSGGTITIATRNLPLTQDGERRIELEVRDNGEGMTEEVAARVFEPFFTTKEPGRGTGLGLATVFGIVGQAGGTITVESAIAKGTSFTVVLPATSRSTDARSLKEQEEARGNETILVVEDDAHVRRLACRALEMFGYTVLTAGNGEDAMVLVRSNSQKIHALLTDVVMPGMGAKALAEGLCEERPNLRVIYMSGHTHDEVAQHGIAVDEHAFVQKPFTPRSLAQKVRASLDLKPPTDSGERV
jgi:two-component system, cell cycle sensor histidine kinase and response regulator CckA